MKRLIIMYWAQFHGKFLVMPKMKFISWFHNLYPDKYCWTDCVGWAFRSDSFNPFRIENARGCEIESIQHEHQCCYCGGWQSGKCFSKLSDEEQEKMRNRFEKEKEISGLPF